MADELMVASIAVRGDTKRLKGDLEQGRPVVKNFFSSLVGDIVGALAAAQPWRVLFSKLREELRLGTEAAIEQAQADKRLEAALRATGHAAGLSADELKNYAANMQRSTGIADDELQNFMAVLLTFRNVQGDVFLEAVELAADMAAIMQTDLSSAALQLGKALNDPIKGMMALQRVGVAFTQQQKDMVKKLVESGRGLEAQKMILAELRREFGGAAAGMLGDTEGEIRLTTAALGEMREETGQVGMQVSLLGKQMEFALAAGSATLFGLGDGIATLLSQGMAQITGWSVTLIQRWDLTWNLARDSAMAAVMGIADIISNFLRMAIDSFGLLGTTIVNLFTSIPSLIQAGLQGGGNAVGVAIEAMLADAALKFHQVMSKGLLELSPLTEQALLKVGMDLAALTQNANNIGSNLFKPPGGAPPGTKFPRPPAAPQEFNTGKGGKPDVVSGFFDITEFSRRIQESLLKQDKTDKLIGIGQAQEAVQKQILAEQQKANAAAASRPAIPVANR
jgi:hypothetical protein